MGKGSIPFATDPGISRFEVEMGALLLGSKEPGIEVLGSQRLVWAMGAWGHREPPLRVRGIILSIT
jgi:hypothetical protein